MPLHQLKDGRWIVQYVNPDPPPRLKREYFGRGDLAERRARERDRELGGSGSGRKSAPRRSGLAVETLVNGYLAARRGRMEDTTLDRLLYKLAAAILPAFGHLDARSLTPARMDGYVNDRLRQGLRRTTVNGEVTYVKAVLNWALEAGHLKSHPLERYRAPSRDDEPIQPATRAETEALLREAAPHLARALTLSYYTGLRPGRQELFRLRWTDIDWDLKTLHIRSARKHGPPSRTVPIHDGLLEVLRAWNRSDENKAGLIITFRGRPVSSLKTAFATAKKRAGITRRLPLYAFRHAFATNLLAAGADLKATSEILGHTRTDTTTRVYQHTNLTQRRTAVSKLPKLPSDNIGILPESKTQKPVKSNR